MTPQQKTAQEQQFVYKINFTLADDERPLARVAYIRALDQEQALLKLSGRYEHRKALPKAGSIDLTEGDFITD